VKPFPRFNDYCILRENLLSCGAPAWLIDRYLSDGELLRVAGRVDTMGAGPSYSMGFSPEERGNMVAVVENGRHSGRLDPAYAVDRGHKDVRGIYDALEAALSGLPYAEVSVRECLDACSPPHSQTMSVYVVAQADERKVKRPFVPVGHEFRFCDRARASRSGDFAIGEILWTPSAQDTPARLYHCNVEQFDAIGKALGRALRPAFREPHKWLGDGPRPAQLVLE